MSYTIGILILFINAVICLKNPNKGLMIYIILCFVCPNIHISSQILSYELCSFVPIFIIYILKNPKIKQVKVHSLLFLYLILLLLASMISLSRYDTYINWTGYLGCVRFVLIIIILTDAQSKNKDFFRKVLLYVITVNLIAVIIQISYSASVQMFYNFYYKDSLVTLDTVLQSGQFYRAQGTFGSPVILGVLSLITFSYFYVEITNKSVNISYIVAILSSMICGIAALSKTFILGVPITIISSVILRFMLIDKKRVKANIKKRVLVIFCIILVGITGYVMVLELEKRGFFIMWYLQFIMKPLEALGTRYDASVGIFNETINVIYKNLIIGVGSTTVNGEFIGDSTYITILHDAGLFGLMIFVIISIKIFYLNLMRKNISKLVIFIILLLAASGFTMFSNIIGALVLAYLSSEFLIKSKI